MPAPGPPTSMPERAPAACATPGGARASPRLDLRDLALLARQSPLRPRPPWRSEPIPQPGRRGSGLTQGYSAVDDASRPLLENPIRSRVIAVDVDPLLGRPVVGHHHGDP